MTAKPKPFKDALAGIAEVDQPISADTVYGLSGLDRERLMVLERTWLTFPVERRRQLLQMLNESSESNFEMDFRDINHMALKDPDSEVRQYAVEGLWEDESLLLMHKLIQIIQHDHSPTVRAAALTELGRFILLGEYGKIPQDQAVLAVDAALTIFNSDEENDLRRRALEAVANSGHDSLSEMINELYTHDDLPMRMSAVFAMGRTCDSDWAPEILREMTSEQPELQFEAARAAGYMELTEAVAPLMRLIEQSEDIEVIEIAIWALGEIGGDRPRKYLTELMTRAEAQDDDVIYEAAQEALDAASLPGDFLLFDFEP